ncbi:hypothetical protein B484DRAFT_436180, partial [Ochromonadaceae sp. CCMP2298]
MYVLYLLYVLQEDAYRMVHAHLLLEGMIDEESDYEDWIASASTWLALGDKCAMHQMYALATDMYSLAIMKDLQALAYEPFNLQLLRVKRLWAMQPQTFQELVNSGNVPLAVPFAPMKDCGVPRKLSLSLAC